MRLRAATLGDVAAMADVHARAFAAPWPAKDIASLMTGMGGFAILAQDDALPPAGFILGRAMGGEAEILTLAVDPGRRRVGLGRALVEALALQAEALAADAVFLEVAADNVGAIALYQHSGFARVGARRGYYARTEAAAVDAVVMRRPLNS